MSVMPSDGPCDSYWQATTPHLPLVEELPRSADIVIVGGGLLGAATCYWLAKAGRNPLLLEQNTLASGATGRNGGFVSIGPAEGYAQAEARLGAATASAVLRVTRENQALVQQVLSEESLESEYRQPGSLHLAVSEQQWNILAQEALPTRCATR